MRKIFTRFKTRQNNQVIETQDNPTEQILNSNDQPAQKTPEIEIPQDQSLNEPETNLPLQPDENDNDNQNSYTNSLTDFSTDSSNILDSNSSQPRANIRHAYTLPMHAKSFHYTVQEGDTLQSISVKFNVKASLIKKANRIYDESNLHTGESIQIFTEIDLPHKFIPIEVSVYDIKDQTDGFPGKLTIKKNNLIFSRKSLFHHHHQIDLCGYLESDVFPHPNDHQHSILVVNYLKNPTDRTTSVSEYFSGEKDDLEKIRIEIIKTADLAQEKVNYKPPNPNSIYYSQDFADTVSIPIKKRRSNSGKVKTQEGPKVTSAVQTMKVFLPTIEFLNGELDILQKTDVFLVRKKLPPRFQNSNWTRLYKSSIDGFLLSTFFKKVSGKKPVLFFLKTNEGDLIGAFVPTGLMISKNFYGDIETFVFKLKTEIPTHDIFITRLSDRRWTIDQNDIKGNAVNQNKNSETNNQETNEKSEMKNVEQVINDHDGKENDQKMNESEKQDTKEKDDENKEDIHNENEDANQETQEMNEDADQETQEINEDADQVIDDQEEDKTEIHDQEENKIVDNKTNDQGENKAVDENLDANNAEDKEAENQIEKETESQDEKVTSNQEDQDEQHLLKDDINEVADQETKDRIETEAQNQETDDQNEKETEKGEINNEAEDQEPMNPIEKEIDSGANEQCEKTILEEEEANSEVINQDERRSSNDPNEIEIPEEEQIEEENANPEIKDQNDDKKAEVSNQNDQKENGNTELNDRNSPEANNQTQNTNTETKKPQTNENKRTLKPRTVIEAYRWNKLKCFDNRNFVLSNNECIIFGGGDSSSIFIDKDMYNGYSDPCDTFGSPRLTKKKRFCISVIEVWQVS